MEETEKTVDGEEELPGMPEDQNDSNLERMPSAKMWNQQNPPAVQFEGRTKTLRFITRMN